MYTLLTCAAVAGEERGNVIDYLEANTVLTEPAPRLPFNLLALSAAAQIGDAGILVQVFT